MGFSLDLTPEQLALVAVLRPARGHRGHPAGLRLPDSPGVLGWPAGRLQVGRGAGKDVLALTGRDLRQYCALLRGRKYSEAIIRRRMVAWREIEERMEEE